MKLYPILFEQDKKPKRFVSYTPPDFALYANETEQLLVLINVPAFKALLKNVDVKTQNMLDACAAMISLEESNNDCLDALQVGLVAGSPSWPGAGITIYALASDFFGSHLTSDRNHSSSVAARETWAKIEKSPEWKKAGEGLDNFAATPNGKIYVDIQGTYPSRTIKPRMGATAQSSDVPNLKIKDMTKNGPRTPEKIDDCPLPTKGSGIDDIQKMSELLGTADAYRYTGSIKAAPLVDYFDSIRSELSSKEQNPYGANIESLLATLAMQLFRYRYQGSETTR